MILHHTGSKDTYITNKIVAGTRRATTSNVGYASTIDMFKLYGENTLKGFKGTCDGVDTDEEASCSGTWDYNLPELSRGLIQFDLADLKTEIEKHAVVTNSSLKLKLVLKDIQGSQVSPSNFTLQLWPISRVWDEGIGDDVANFSSLSQSNWLKSNESTSWSQPGGDWITSWNAADDSASADSRTYIATQDFVSGEEDLEMDITDWVKALWSSGNTSVQNNYGWILKFSTEETEAKSYFVKRFASRHTRNPFLRPKLIASWEEYTLDDRLDFEADNANKIYVQNYVQSQPTSLTGAPTCTLSYSTYTSSSLGEAVSIAGKSQIGMYSAQFAAISSENSVLSPHLVVSGSLLLQEQWVVGSKTVYSGSIKLVRPLARSSDMPRNLRFSIIDLKTKYSHLDVPKIRLFVRDRSLIDEPVRIPIKLESQVVQKVYYQIKDTNSLNILIPFSDSISVPDESTRMSIDSSGMFFSFPVSVLPRGRTYTIDIAFYDRGERRIYESNQAFRVI
tara:strand:- start:11215 stop:12732 length:1518 start_codon:yes stop_codon:yes gene_type:complete